MTDFTSQYNTPLSPEDELQYQAWRADLSRQRGFPMNEADYDLRGAWKAGAAQAENGHFPDTFKKPNHPTFSTESQYSGTASGVTGGEWKKVGDRWRFIASPDQLKFWSPQDLQGYFSRVEPDSELVFQNTPFKPQQPQGLGAGLMPVSFGNIFGSGGI
jgi:hypothetical protein